MWLIERSQPNDFQALLLVPSQQQQRQDGVVVDAAFVDVHGGKHPRALDGCGGSVDPSVSTVWSSHLLGFEVAGGQAPLVAPRGPTGWLLARFVVEEASGSPATRTFTELFAWLSLVRNSTQPPALQPIENAVIVSWVLNWRGSQVLEKGG